MHVERERDGVCVCEEERERERERESTGVFIVPRAKVSRGYEVSIVKVSKQGKVSLMPYSLVIPRNHSVLVNTVAFSIIPHYITNSTACARLLTPFYCNVFFYLSLSCV
jgi:hypothetical protein